MQIQIVAVGWSVFNARHQAFDLGLVGLVLFLPTFLLVFVAGHVADRYDRKAIAIAATLLEAVCSVLLALLVARPPVALGPMLAVLFMIGVARAFGEPVARTMFVTIVAPQHFLRVQSLYSSIREVISIGGPALGGILVAWSSAGALVTSATLMLAAPALFALMRLPRVARVSAVREVDGAGLGSALAGLRFIRSQPIVLGAITLDLFAVLFGGATTLLPVFAASILHVGAVGFGVLRSAPAIGSAASAIVITWRPIRRRTGVTLLTTVAVFGLATIVFAFSRNIVLSITALAVIGASDMVSVVIRSGLIALNTPDAMRGRVNAVENVFIGASNELGGFESGSLAALIGTVPSVAFGGAAVLVVVALCTRFVPALRALDRLTVSENRS